MIQPRRSRAPHDAMFVKPCDDATATNPNPLEDMSTSDPPIPNLPEELLTIIFDCLITSSPPLNKFPFAVSVPTLLSHVSRRWRTIISTTPSMWTQVPISPFQSIHTLRSFLHHSSPLPISVTAYQWPLDHPYIPPGTMTDQLNLLLGAEADRERIYVLRVEATAPSDFSDSVIRAFVGERTRPVVHFPALRHVSLNGALRGMWFGSHFFDTGNAPALNSFVLNDIAVNRFTRPPRFELQAPQSLTTLVWKRSTSTVVGDYRAVPIGKFRDIVSTFPSLTALELHGEIINLEDADEAYFGTITQGPPLTKIKSLRIAHPFTLPTSALDLFRLFPSLTYIFVGDKAGDGHPSTNSTLCALRALAGSPEVLPFLQEAHFEFRGAESGSLLNQAVRGEVKTWLENRKSVLGRASGPTVVVNGA
ncbi:hypothetical protein PAXRUDRAFT_625242 [Paxillus rubicundulus Ve08.2h10]|uniref:F-box domain-containing protein n=1 Tax=Paxillus rubicundulus Ve08.2h10 TaxID=930991 RepID=A0A0D0DK76_9AGAM|nr:hypothetical protein PAXRUDRAFT_625242 [Paxillus rubicundulus Ve08.2h10]